MLKFPSWLLGANILRGVVTYINSSRPELNGSMWRIRHWGHCHSFMSVCDNPSALTQRTWLFRLQREHVIKSSVDWACCCRQIHFNSSRASALDRSNIVWFELPGPERFSWVVPNAPEPVEEFAAAIFCSYLYLTAAFSSLKLPPRTYDKTHCCSPFGLSMRNMSLPVGPFLYSSSRISKFFPTTLSTIYGRSRQHTGFFPV